MFLPESIDLEHSEKYILSIRIKTNGFMFSITDPENAKNFCLRETTFTSEDNLLSNVQRIIFELNFLTQEFKQTNVVFVSKNYNLVPALLFDKKAAAELYNFTHFEKTDYTLSGLIENQDIAVAYSVDKDLVDFLSRSLFAPNYFHHSNLLINWIDKRGKFLKSKSKMFAYFEANMMDIFCFYDTKLIHSLSYENENPADQAYYLLKLWEHCGFNQQEDTLYLMGDADRLVIARAQLYINKIEDLTWGGEIASWSDDAKKTPLDLLTLSL